MPAECRDCKAAEANPHASEYTARCMGCEARALASLGSHIESAERGSMTPRFRQTCERLWGEQWLDGAKLAKAWGERFAAAAKRAKMARLTR